MNSPILIVGSARNDGNTFRMVDTIRETSDIPLIDLTTFFIEDFDYAHENRGDDFIALMEQIVDIHDILIFVSPVYWYSMSGVMKRFFDRLTDLLTIEKEIGRKLRGKKMLMLCCSASEELNPGFEEPFRLSADYLGMEYLGYLHMDLSADIMSKDQKLALHDFIKTKIPQT